MKWCKNVKFILLALLVCSVALLSSCSKKIKYPINPNLNVTVDTENEESDDSRDMTLDDEPSPRTCLYTDDVTELHGATKDDGCHHAQTERNLIRDHLHGTTHG